MQHSRHHTLRDWIVEDLHLTAQGTLEEDLVANL